jgi:hypothetical protein
MRTLEIDFMPIAPPFAARRHLDIFGIGSAAGAIGGAAIQAGATETAAQDQLQAAQAAIAEQKSEFGTTQANEAPWISAGTGALSQLTAGTAPGGSLVTPDSETFQQPAPFVSPTLDNTNDPGYAFRLQQGEQALARGATASGGAFSGGTLKALQRYGQDYASNEYNNVYNRALTNYSTNFNDALTGYQTRFNTYNTNQGNTYNRLASLSGLGQTAVGQLNAAGTATAGNISNLLTQQGNASSAAALGIGGALNSGIQNTLNSYQNGQILKMLTGGSGGGGYAGSPAELSNFDSSGNFIPAGSWSASGSSADDPYDG